MISPRMILPYTPQSHISFQHIFLNTRGKKGVPKAQASHGYLKMGLLICFMTKKVAQQEDENPS